MDQNQANTPGQQPAPSQPAPSQQPPQMGYPQGQPTPPVNNDTGGIGWAILGFFFPVIGLILWLVWKDTKPNNAHKAGKGALIGVIVWLVLSFLIMGMSFCAAASLTAGYSGY